MSDAIEVRASDIPDIEAEGREILARRKGEIEDGRLDGGHWFLALLIEARDVVRRRRTAEARRRSRT
jgi:hypothetical protein